jgi:primase-polymerase (primpol)-like protein
MTDFNKPLAVNADGIPDELKKIPRWLVWRYVNQGGSKPDKVPYRWSGEKATGTNFKNALSTFELAMKAYRAVYGGKFDGIGFVFNGDGIVGIDVDGVIDPETGEIDELALEALRDIPGYAEYSPSGTGLHLLTLANPRRTGKHGQVEVYTKGRFFTVTGHQINGHAMLPSLPQDIEAFVAKHLPALAHEKDGTPPKGAGGRPRYWTLGRVIVGILEALTEESDFECGNWIKVLQGMHRQFAGTDDEEEAIRATVRLSQRDPKLERIASEAEIRKKWDRFDATGGITIATLIAMAGGRDECRWRVKNHELREANKEQRRQSEERKANAQGGRQA